MKNNKLNNMQEAIIKGDINRLLEIADYECKGESGLCTAQAAIKVNDNKESIAEFYVDGILFDGDMEDVLSYKNDYEYMNKQDLISWEDIVKITSSETGKSIYVPVAQKEEFDTPDDYLIIDFAEENIEDIKDGRNLYEYLIVKNENLKIKWALLEDEFPEFNNFKNFTLENTIADLENKTANKLKTMSDKDICLMLKKYLTNRKYIPEY